VRSTGRCMNPTPITYSNTCSDRSAMPWMQITLSSQCSRRNSKLQHPLKTIGSALSGKPYLFLYDITATCAAKTPIAVSHIASGKARGGDSRQSTVVHISDSSRCCPWHTVLMISFLYSIRNRTRPHTMPSASLLRVTWAIVRSEGAGR